MVNKMWTVLVEIIFPRTHLEKYLMGCAQIEFEQRLTPRMQKQARIFAPYYYKDPFVKDCILEIKERCNRHAARLFGRKIAQWIAKNASELREVHETAPIYVVPVPQHMAKTREKGFAHAHVLAEEIVRQVPAHVRVTLFPCLEKAKSIRRLHDLSSRSDRFRTIKRSMRAHITKEDAERAYFFIIDDVYTTGATFKEARRSLADCGALPDQIFFSAIAH